MLTLTNNCYKVDGGGDSDRDRLPQQKLLHILYASARAVETPEATVYDLEYCTDAGIYSLARTT